MIALAIPRYVSSDGTGEILNKLNDFPRRKVPVQCLGCLVSRTEERRYLPRGSFFPSSERHGSRANNLAVHLAERELTAVGRELGKIRARWQVPRISMTFVTVRRVLVLPKLVEEKQEEKEEEEGSRTNAPELLRRRTYC